MAKADFWYEFASTYSYPAAMRVESLAADRKVVLAWRPFLLGPIFAAQGWRIYRSISIRPRADICGVTCNACAIDLVCR